MFFRRTRWTAAQSQEVHLIENRSWNVFNVTLARQNSGNIDIGLEDIKSKQANNINLSLNHVTEPSAFLDYPQNSS